MRNCGYTHAIAIVFDGMTYEDEAKLYSTQNINNRSLKPIDLFKSGIEANDEAAVRINEIVETNGFQIGSGGKNNYSRITAILALYSITSEYGFNILDDTLCLIASTWNGLTKATQAASLLGVAEFIHRYGMADFADRLQSKCISVWYDYEEEKRNRSAGRLMASQVRFCRILVEKYNAGLPSKSNKRLVWEG
jgi:hypothetical protein